MFRIRNRKERQIEKALINLPKYHDKSYTYHVEVVDDTAYLKLFYEETPTDEEVDEVYVSSLHILEKSGFKFKGITFYRDNHEICLSFNKNF